MANATHAISPSISHFRRIFLHKTDTDQSFGMTMGREAAEKSLYAFVKYIFPNSPAERAGVQQGWKIVEVGKTNVERLHVREIGELFKGATRVEILFFETEGTAQPIESISKPNTLKSIQVKQKNPVAAPAPIITRVSTSTKAQATPTATPTNTSPASNISANGKGKQQQRKRKLNRTTPTQPKRNKTSEECKESFNGGNGDAVANLLSRSSRMSSEDGVRARQSRTVDRLVSMGFVREDAMASVSACGNNPDDCMVWIISHMEEKQFLKDLNQASIASEESKRQEEKELKKIEKETLKNADSFASLFPTSYIIGDNSQVGTLKDKAENQIVHFDADCVTRVEFTKLLKLETQAVKWYNEAPKCYMLDLASRLDSLIQSHEVKKECCDVQSSTCDLALFLKGEVQKLNDALFAMPENKGGVPLAFLHADEAMRFSLDDDGFEVVEILKEPEEDLLNRDDEEEEEIKSGN